MTRFAVGMLLLVAWSAPARAQGDPEFKEPYHLRVVLHFAKHRLLTQPFRDQVRRELRDGLETSLGYLARVEIREDHRLLAEIDKDPKDGLRRVLDGWTDIEPVKTHFVLIDFVQGRYEIQARQHDGFTGLSSPVVRRETILERQLVARRAAQLLDQDFGLVGSVGQPQGDKVRVALKGGGLPVPLDHWLKKDDVFAVAQVFLSGGASRSTLERGTLLQVLEEPREGVCLCQLYHRYQNPLAAGSYRCLKLGTADAPLRLRFVDERSGIPIAGLQVRIDMHGGQTSPTERLSTRPDGQIESKQRYRNMALVRVFVGEAPLTGQIPVEVVGDRTVTIPVARQPGAEVRGQVAQDRQRWYRHLADSTEAADAVVKDLNALRDQPGAVLMDKAMQGLEALKKDLGALVEEREALRKKAGQLAQGGARDLAEGERRLGELEGRRTALQEYIDRLKKIGEEENDPKHQRWKELAEQARLLESDHEYGKAIELYEKILSEGADDAVLRAKLEKLKAAWATKGDAHAKARKFIYEDWPDVQDTADLKAKLPQAHQALQACREAGDYLTPRMLLKVNAAHATRLEKEVEKLRPEREDDRQAAKMLDEVINDLNKLNKEAQDYLRRATPAGK
jgi:hypothetical protein